MPESSDNKPYSTPAGNAANGPSNRLGVVDWIKVIACIPLALLILPFIPFGLIGKGIYAVGISFAIFNYSNKLKSTNNVINCPKCERVVSVSTSICPRCETRL